MMIKNLFISLVFVLSLNGCASSDAYGPISRAQLQTTYPTFRAQMAGSAEARLLQQHWSQHSSLRMKVFFATWCHDSQREIPRLLGLLEAAQLPDASVELIALDRDKQDPAQQTRRYHIARTPTLLLLQDEQEIGRIIERPQQSWSADLLNLLAIAP